MSLAKGADIGFDDLSAALSGLAPHSRLRQCAVPGLDGLRFILLDPAFEGRDLDVGVRARIAHEPPYWALAWPGGRVLAQRIASGRLGIRGRRVVEVGCGSGLVAMAAAAAGAARVQAFDLDPLARRATALNAELNGLTVEVGSDLFSADPEADWILVADVLYDRGNRPLLERLLERPGRLALADCRDHGFSHPRLLESGWEDSAVWPDVDPSVQFRRVRWWETL